MKGRQIPIFATPADISMVLNKAAFKRSLKYFLLGLFDQMDPISVDINEPLSMAGLLSIESDSILTPRLVLQHDGSKKYAVDQLCNPHSVAIKTGGFVGGERLVSGQVGTISDDAKSIEIYSTFLAIIKNDYKKIKSYYVGPEAARLFDDGIRLSPTEKSPKEYDLRRI